MPPKVNRREFLEASGKAALGVGLGAVAASALATPTYADTAQRRRSSPKDKITMALIGCGGMGRANMGNLLGHSDVQFAACCDVDSKQLEGAVNQVEKRSGKKPD